MAKDGVQKHLALGAAVAGILFESYICFFKPDEISLFSVVLFIWASMPYLACMLISKRLGSDFGFYGAFACICGSALTYNMVFVSPNSSTAAIHLLFSPLTNLFFFLPIGVLLGGMNKLLNEKTSNPAP